MTYLQTKRIFISTSFEFGEITKRLMFECNMASLYTLRGICCGSAGGAGVRGGSFPRPFLGGHAGRPGTGCRSRGGRFHRFVTFRRGRGRRLFLLGGGFIHKIKTCPAAAFQRFCCLYFHYFKSISKILLARLHRHRNLSEIKKYDIEEVK